MPGFVTVCKEAGKSFFIRTAAWDLKNLLIRGGYGCGKSILCQIKLSKLAESSKEGTKIYYLCHDSHFQIVHHKRQIANSELSTSWFLKEY